MASGVLVRFGEIGIKSVPVRRRMLDRLQANLTEALLRDGVEGGASRLGSRLWLAGPDPVRLADVARRVFGVVSVSPASEVPAEMGALLPAAAEAAMARPGDSFAVRAKREGEHPFGSQELAREAGGAVLEAAEAAGRFLRVDLTDPDLEVHIDVRGARAFVFTGVLPGPGGLPLGTQGRVVALVSDPASMLAAWLMMRRGCDVWPVHGGEGEPEGVDVLRRWGLRHDVHALPPSGKSGLLEAAAAYARRRRAAALVTGDRIGSRLLAASMPVLRPLCGLDAVEARRWQALAGLPGAHA